MKDITIIVPVVNMENEKKKEPFIKAIERIDDSPIIVVGPENDIKAIETLKLSKIMRVLVNKSQDTSYAFQVNYAVKDVKTTYFSVLEFDDIYTSIWFKNVQQYLDTDTEDTFAFLPLTEVIDVNMGPVGFANEAVWASSFSEEIGCYDLQCLEDYLDFNTSGGIFKTQDFITLGSLKASMKLSFWYEFLLRATYKGKRIFVIPKIGYNHFIGREDSLSYINLAKKEYFFPHDRNKTYQEE